MGRLDKWSRSWSVLLAANVLLFGLTACAGWVSADLRGEQLRVHPLADVTGDRIHSDAAYILRRQPAGRRRHAGGGVHAGAVLPRRAALHGFVLGYGLSALSRGAAEICRFWPATCRSSSWRSFSSSPLAPASVVRGCPLSGDRRGGAAPGRRSQPDRGRGAAGRRGRRRSERDTGDCGGRRAGAADRRHPLSNDIVLELVDIRRRFPGFEMGPLSLKLRPGRIYGLLGPNGAGKTRCSTSSRCSSSPPPAP